VLTAVTFSLFGFILGIWADGFEKLQVVPMMIITPLTFLGGSFYGLADVSVGLSASMILLFLAVCMFVVRWMFKTGYRLRP
jgi:ABC-2 type transport system permease protein